MKHNTLFNISLLFFLSLLMMFRQLITPGYFSCIIQDTSDYASWAWQFIEALKEGIIYPRWTPFSYWGYGSPFFILYPPLAFYLVAFFNIFTDSVISAMNLTKFMALFLSATGMFFLVREFYSEKIALLTATFYVLFPYNIFGFYYSGTFGSIISLIWFAPILLLTYKYLNDRQFYYILYAGLCFGGLILTHLINAYMFSFVIVAFIIYMGITKKTPKDLIAIPLIFIVGLLTSAFYVIPLIYEKRFINTEYFIGEGFYFSDFFILPNLTEKLPSGSFWPVYYDIYSFYVFLFFILVILFTIRLLKSRLVKSIKDTNRVNMFFIGIAFISIFLLFGVSSFVWEFIPFFKYVEFPYRWLNIATFAVVFLSAGGFFLPNNSCNTERRHNMFIASVFLILLLLNVKYINSANVFSEQELIPIRPVNYNAVHMPIWVDYEKIDKNDNKDKVVIVSGKGKAKVVQWKSAERVIEIMAEKSITLRIRTFNFPGWKACIDGMQTEIETQDITSAMLINIPKGKHRLMLKFEDTPVRHYSKAISLVSLFGMIFFAFSIQRET